MANRQRFECVANRQRFTNQFKTLKAGDLFVVVRTNFGKRVTAVAVVQGEQLAKQSNQNLLLQNLEPERHTAIKQYLGDAPTFNLVFFKKVFDCRSLEIDLRRLVASVDGLTEPANLQGPRYMNMDVRCQCNEACDSLMLFLRDRQCPVHESLDLENSGTDVD